ncbi:somatomedin-B and thrombospondin type-1 domain-containing protein [Scleropages formosus]|uniref:Somatomedin B and thrombospondin type 1 domain containing n=1 Tax=Scleropages formosus TaxID=113540 RepID=A0A8C9V390_SCLFO|nr:somatomedin-B and thrombospondin type-1 domain-containing protein [Scleropages formosus]
MWGLWLWAVALGAWRSVEAGCSGRCCPGTDLTCASTDWRTDRNFGSCFCDENCQRTKDCCFDYPTVCPAEHCRVSQWSSWSGCSQQCHPAFRHRKRHIEKEPSNSGDACPPLEERAGCLEYLDRQGRNCALALGPALITSAEHGKGRPTHDPYGQPVDPGYCVEFKMVSLTSHCAADGQPHLRWTQYLREGYTVCVACQPPAMQEPDRSCQGDGATSGRDELLHWQAVDNPHCRGTWSRVRMLERCACPQVHHFVFI